MKKKEFALALVLALLFSATAGVYFASLVEANPIGMFPTQPEPLQVTFLSPKNGSRWFQNSMSISFSLQNPTLGFASSITYSIDDSTKGTVNGVITAKEGERFRGYFDLLEYQATLDLSGLTDGWHTLTVTAIGMSPYNPVEGGMGYFESWVSGSDSIQFLYDVSAPTITILIDQNQTYTNTDVPLIFALSEKADWIGFSLNEQSPTTIAGNTTLIGLPIGFHSLDVYANDTVGRKGTSETVYFSIENKVEETIVNQAEHFPTTLVTTTASVASVFIVGIGLLVYFKKRKQS